MTTRAESYQRRIAQEREALLAKARAEIAREDADAEERSAQERAEREAWTEVRREREARRREAEAHALAQVAAPVTATSEEDSEMASKEFGSSTAAPKPSRKAARRGRKVTAERPHSAAGRKRALKGAEGVKEAQAHRRTKKEQAAKLPGAPRSRERANAIIPGSGDLITKALDQAETKAASKNGAGHPATEQFAAGKEKGVRVASASRGGFHVIVVGTLNRALKGVFPEAVQAKDAAEAAGLEVKAMPRA